MPEMLAFRFPRNAHSHTDVARYVYVASIHIYISRFKGLIVQYTRRAREVMRNGVYEATFCNNTRAAGSFRRIYSSFSRHVGNIYWDPAPLRIFAYTIHILVYYGVYADRIKFIYEYVSVGTLALHSRTSILQIYTTTYTSTYDAKVLFYTHTKIISRR